MNDYIDIAKQYFRHLEGLHLYPSLRNAWTLSWLAATAVWLTILARFATLDHSSRDEIGIAAILVPEVIWLLITFRIQTLKERRLVEETNRRLGTSFESPSECRRHVLAAAVAAPPSEFLRVAKEIDELMSLKRRFRKYSDLSWAELGRKIYDRDSKARLLTLMIALVSITVALAAKSDATLETLFEVYSERAARELLLIVAVWATIFFVLYVGLQVLVRTIIGGLALWAIKLLGGSPQWLLEYLVRDLVMYHSNIEPDLGLRMATSADKATIDTPPDVQSVRPVADQQLEPSAATNKSNAMPPTHGIAAGGNHNRFARARWLVGFMQELWQRPRIFAVSLARRGTANAR